MYVDDNPETGENVDQRFAVKELDAAVEERGGPGARRATHVREGVGLYLILLCAFEQEREECAADAHVPSGGRSEARVSLKVHVQA